MKALRPLTRPLGAGALAVGLVLGAALALVVVDMIRTTESAPAVVVADEATLREGPGDAYPEVLVLTHASEVTVVGRNQDSTWLAINNPGNTEGSPVWIAATDIDLGDTGQEELAVLAPPATPTEPSLAGASPPAGSTPKGEPTRSTGGTTVVASTGQLALPACSTATDRPSPCISRVELLGEPALAEPFTVRVTASNLGADSDLGAISVSLPDGARAELDPGDRQGTFLYEAGRSISRCGDYQEGACRGGSSTSVTSQYSLAEKVLNPWRNGVEQTFLVTVNPLPEQDTVNVLIRFALRAPSGDIPNFPAESATLDSQQNLPVYQYAVRLGRLSVREEQARAEVESIVRSRGEANTAFYRDVDITAITRITTGEALAIYEGELARLNQIGAYIDARQILFAVVAVELIDANNAVVHTFETWDNIDHSKATDAVTGSRRARAKLTYTVVREQGAWMISGLEQEVLSQEPLPTPP